VCRFEPLFLALGLVLGACGSAEQVVIPVRTTKSLIDPTLVSQVAIAALHEPALRCVAPVSCNEPPCTSNTCLDLTSTTAAAQASGFLQELTLSRSAGTSTARFEGLPQGRTCFLAEARDGQGSSVGRGCADVTLSSDRLTVLIVIE
jgi:hypothetical protein